MQEQEYKTFNVTMDWTREKAIWMLKDDIYLEKYLNTLDNHELFKLGAEQGYWYGSNPFKKETQTKIMEFF